MTEIILTTGTGYITLASILIWLIINHIYILKNGKIEFIEGATVKVYNGTEWKDYPVKLWNGEEW